MCLDFESVHYKLTTQLGINF
uniref:Uncharacterized protein n=1 Tax=Rhizophora mucronata TaxID=61149 RepID=A0A2P2P474_RHIMU